MSRKIRLFKRLFKVEQNGVFLFVIYFFVPEIFKFSYCANLVTDDVIGCASTVVWHKIKNISAKNEAMVLKLGRDVAPNKIYQMLHIVMLLWQHAPFQFPTSLKWNSTICDSARQNTWSYLRHMLVPPSLSLLFSIFSYFAPCSYNWKYLIFKRKGLEPSMCRSNITMCTIWYIS